MSKRYPATRARLTTVRYENAFQTPLSDPRLRDRSGNGVQGLGTCPHCGAGVKLRLANTEYRDLPEIGQHTIVCANHAVGGGRKTRNDYYCPGSGRLPL